MDKLDISPRNHTWAKLSSRVSLIKSDKAEMVKIVGAEMVLFGIMMINEPTGKPEQF